jgi:predicted ferric reductase
MGDITAVDISSTVGLIAMYLLTVNLLLGLLVSVNYQPERYWPHRKLPFPFWKLHNWNAYVAIGVACLHPTILLFASGKDRFRLLDILAPINSPHQTFYNNLGAITFYSFLFVVVTSYFRPKLRYRPWKKLHYVAYFAGIMMYIHGTLTDPNLKDQPTDFLDGEKIQVELCFLLVLGASIWRWRFGKEKQRWQAARALKAAAGAD